MRVTLSVDAGAGERTDAADGLYAWLRQDPRLRGLVRRETPGGAQHEVITLHLAPGGPAAAVGEAVAVWLHNGRGERTVTLALPDGAGVVVSSEQVRGPAAEGTDEVAGRIARALVRQPGGAPQGDG